MMVELSSQQVFKLMFKKVAVVDMSQIAEFLAGKTKGVMTVGIITAMTVLNLLIHNTLMYTTTSYRIGTARAFFSPEIESHKFKLPGGLDLWRGLISMANLGINQATVNIGMKLTLFYPINNMVNILKEYFDVQEIRKPLEPWQISEFRKFIYGVNVIIKHGNSTRSYTVNGITTGTTNNSTFDMDGKMVTVTQYFFDKYNIRLVFPYLPCLLLGSKKILMPMELCFIEKLQRWKSLSTAKQLSAIPKVSPKETQQQIQTFFNKMNMINTDIFEAYNIKVNPNMVKINARHLPCPQIKYKNNNITPSNGSWNLRNLEFVQGSDLRSFGVVNFADRRIRENQVEGVMDVLLQVAKEVGVEHNTSFPIIKGDIRDIVGSFRTAYKRIGDYHRMFPQLVYVIMPDSSAQNYRKLKNVAEVEIGVPTQVMLVNKVMNQRGLLQYAANVMLKVNSKIPAQPNAIGINSCLKDKHPIFNQPTMIMGADVTHAPQSIAALVSSWEKTATRFHATISQQKDRVEEIQDVENMMSDHINYFKQRNRNLLPQHIIFYRDGVSVGQYERVLKIELTALKSALYKLGANNTKVTFIIVTKRHNTRFFPTSSRDADKSGNLLPGILVDKEITHPTDFHFFLLSHAGLLGTSRPTQYTVIHDEYKFQANDLQLLTYHLCYTYVRASKSVSIVAPVYYAHLVAKRALCYVDNNNKMQKMKENLCDSMFFV